MLDLTINKDIVIIEGRLDVENATSFENAFLEKTTHYPYYFIQCEKLEYLSSAGIRALLKTAKNLGTANEKIIFCSLNPYVKKIFQVAGLLNLFEIYDDIETARGNVTRKILNIRQGNINNKTYYYQSESQEEYPALLQFKNDSLLKKIKKSPADMRYAIGNGNNRPDEKNSSFIIFGNKFIIFNNEISDLYLTDNHDGHSLWAEEIQQWPYKPGLRFECSDKDTIHNHLQNLLRLPEISVKEPLGAFIILAKIHNQNQDSIIIGTYSKEEIMEKPVIEIIKAYEIIIDEKKIVIDEILSSVPEELLNMSNFVTAGTTDLKKEYTAAGGWIFPFSRIKDIREDLLNIEYENPIEFCREEEETVRELFKNSKKVILKTITGGFSSRVFRATAYDHMERQAMPYVMKLGDKDLIKREEKAFQENVKTFILNHSTNIIRSFHGKKYSAICYNFVGMGVTDNLTMLRDLYHQLSITELITFFKKVYCDILNPWYGQPKRDYLYPFKEHDPRDHFFKTIVEDGENYYQISADDKWIYCPYLERDVMNPYWFLRENYGKLRDYSISSYKGITHGDLNLQNILLDDRNNIFIIDFSETAYKNITRDFARLETILKIEFTDIEKEEDIKQQLTIEEKFIKLKKITDSPIVSKEIKNEKLKKCYSICEYMRELASRTTIFDETAIPYLTALIEWVYPVVIYRNVSPINKKFSLFNAGLTAETIYKILKEEGHLV